MGSPVLIQLDSKDPSLSRIREIARAARDGKIIAFPTETVYGIGGPMSASKIEERLREIKGRSEGKPFSYHLGDWNMIDFLKIRRTPAFRYLTEKFWPGPLTIVAPNYEEQKCGLRFPDQKVTAALISACGEPFIGTSANRSGEVSPRSADEVIEKLGDLVDYVIDCGMTRYRMDSTVVDITADQPVILRKAALGSEIEEAVLNIEAGKFPRKRILFVCTGNSCRSPMAKAWLDHELEKTGLIDTIQVQSCGIGARVGSRATTEALFVMKNREIDLSDHRSRPCTREDVMNADMIFAMSQEHGEFISGLVPASKEKITVLNVADPIGLSMPVYEETIQAIETKLKALWQRIIA